MTGAPELVGIRYSPYTEKALWALDYHRQPYRYREHLVLLGDAILELRIRRAGGVLPADGLTVPVLFHPEGVLFDSFEILRKVDEEGAARGAEVAARRLIPEGALPEMKHFNLLADTIMNAGRALYMERLGASREGQLASFPQWIPARPSWIRGACLPLVRAGIESINDQFRITRKTSAEYSNHLLQCLVGLRSHREHATSKDFLWGDRFTAADLVVASALAVIKPPAFLESRTKPELFSLWTHPELSREFDDLLQWRDQIYSRHRKV